MDGRFPVKILIFTIGVIIKTFPQRKHCTQALECQSLFDCQGLCTCQLQFRPIGFEKAKIYRGFLPIKEVVQTDSSNRTSTPSTFVAEKINVLRCYRYPGLCIIHFYHFLSLQMNEILQFISLQMNEILKVELQFVSSQGALDVSIIVRNPEVNPMISSC